VMARIPPEMFSKLEGAELYHQLLEHRWFLSEQAGHDVPLAAALDSYLDTVLADAPDELLHLGEPTQELPVIEQGAISD
jgi:hypothetical protein